MCLYRLLLQYMCIVTVSCEVREVVKDSSNCAGDGTYKKVQQMIIDLVATQGGCIKGGRCLILII